MNKSDVTIIIPHFHINASEKALGICLDSLIASDFPRENIIVAINGDFPEFPYLPEKVKFIWVREQGQCKAVNAVAATVNTPWIMVSNNDMVYPKDWFERLTNDLPRNVSCVSPKLIEPRAGAPTFEVYFCGGLGGDWQPEKFFEFAEKYQNTEFLRNGFNLPFLIKKELWDLISGYNISYDPFSSNSDSDLEYKIRLAGVQPYQNTRCIVYHFSQTSGTFEPKNQSYWSKNWDYFINFWGFPRTDDGIWTADFHMPTREQGRKFFPEWENKYA